MREGLAAYGATGARLWRPYYLALMAETHANVAQVENGLAELAEAVELAQSTSEHEHEAELYRLRGELILKQCQPGSLDPAVQKEAVWCFQNALDIARKQQARSLELRAVISLSRLWQREGKQQEARKMVAEIYNWFTEDFETADLKDAKAHLRELGA